MNEVVEVDEFDDATPRPRSSEMQRKLEEDPQTAEVARFISEALTDLQVPRLIGSVVHKNGYMRLIEDQGWGDTDDLFQEAYIGLISGWKEYNNKDSRYTRYEKKVIDYYTALQGHFDQRLIPIGYLKNSMRSQINRYIDSNIGSRGTEKRDVNFRSRTFTDLEFSGGDDGEDNEEYIMGMISLNVDRLDEANSIPKNTFASIDEFFDVDPINFEDEDAPDVRRILFEAAEEALFENRMSTGAGRSRELRPETIDLERKVFQALYIDQKPLKQAYLEDYIMDPESDQDLVLRMREILVGEGLMTDDGNLKDVVWGRGHYIKPGVVSRGMASRLEELDPRLHNVYKNTYSAASGRVVREMKNKQDLIRSKFVEKLREHKEQQGDKLV
jgi:hypothetical protein